MNKIWQKKQYILIFLAVVLFAFTSCLSFMSINQMRGNARAVNYAGIVRGATQRLVKKELQGHPDDSLIKRLDFIISDLINGGGANNLVALQDEEYQNNMADVQRSWSTLKAQILLVRGGSAKDSKLLFELSEEYFNLVDHAVSSAETFSELQLDKSMQLLISVSCVFALLVFAGIMSSFHTVKLKKRADTLDKLAYIDILTQMPNRANCERELEKYTADPSLTNELAVFMFDMNNLKIINDLLGHQSGDRVIADFARIMKAEAVNFGFVGRFGGDEFIAIFKDCNETRANTYLLQLNEKVNSYNLMHLSTVEKMSFAAGFVIADPKKMQITEMINKADAKMYERKRQMKENKE